MSEHKKQMNIPGFNLSRQNSMLHNEMICRQIINKASPGT